MKILVLTFAIGLGSSTQSFAQEMTCVATVNGKPASSVVAKVQLTKAYEQVDKVYESAEFKADMHQSGGNFHGLTVSDKTNSLSFYSDGKLITLQDSAGSERLRVHCVE